MLADHEVARALEIARELAGAGVPIFVAAPCPGETCGRPGHGAGRGPGFDLPVDWDRARPDPSVVDRWRPGYALAAVGGHVVDFVDTDPRNGGDVSAAELKASGAWPTSYGQQYTPSGGVHDLIVALRIGKGVPRRGVDLQGGRPDGTGRGFVFLSPTVRASKVTGERLPYRWVTEPDLARLAEWGELDETGRQLADMITAKRAPDAGSWTPPVPADGAPAPYGDPARSFTMSQAVDFCRPAMGRLATAPNGEINDRLNDAAKVLQHFVAGGFWTYGQGAGFLMEALASTQYDGRTWQAENTIRSAFTSTQGAWPAQLVPEPWEIGGAGGYGPPNQPGAMTGTAAGPRGADGYAVAGVDPISQADGFLVRLGQLAAAAGKLAAPDPVELLRRQWLDSTALRALADPVPLVDGWIDRDSTGAVIGPSGSMKSFAVLDLAAAVGAGRSWHGHDVPEAAEVWIMVAEGATGLRKRVRAWEIHHDREMVGVRFLPRPIQAMSPEWLVLIEMARQDRPGLVFVDTQARVTAGMEENSNTEMGLFIARMDAIRVASMGAAVFAVHHTGHEGERARGASALKGAWTTELQVRKEKAVGGGYQVTVSQSKQKDQADDTELVLDTRVVEVGRDARGRVVDSVVLLREGETASGYVPVISRGRWDALLAELDQSRLNIIDVMRAIFVGDVGGTKPEIRQESLKFMSSATFKRAWNELVSRGVLLRIEGSQRFTLRTVDGDDEPGTNQGESDNTQQAQYGDPL